MRGGCVDLKKRETSCRREALGGDGIMLVRGDGSSFSVPRASWRILEWHPQEDKTFAYCQAMRNPMLQSKGCR